MASLKVAAVAAGMTALTLAASVPAEAGGYGRRGGWSPGAAAAVGILGGVAAGAAIASAARPAYAAPPAYYAPPPPEAYGECYVVHKRVWVPGWGWDVRPREICD